MKYIAYFLFFITLSLHSVFSQVTQIKGLAVIVEYPDKKFDISTEYLDSMLNQKTGFTLYNHIGSLREYYYQQTNSKYDITHKTIRFTLNVNYGYFSGSVSPTGESWDAGQVFVDSVSSRLKKMYPDGFTNLTLDPRKSTPSLWSYLIITPEAGVAFGISAPKSINNNGSPILLNHVALAGLGGGTATNNSVSTIAHECGHALFSFIDYYIINPSRPLEISNIGAFCLMGSGGNKYSPQALSGGLRVALGTTDVLEIPDNEEKTYKIKSNDRTKIYRYNNPNDANEYFLIEALKHGDWYQSPNGDGYELDEGLAVWHVYENSSNSRAPWIKLVQADGIDEMNLEASTHKEKRGCDLSDLFGTGSNGVAGTGVKVDAVNGETNPLMRWRDGSIPGLYLKNISAPADSMSFTVEHRENTIISSVLESSRGTISPMGMISVDDGENKTFTFTPELGYEVNEVFVDDVSQGNITSYTFTSVNADHTISVSFKSVVSVLPDPWKTLEVGGSTGKSDYADGVFRLESTGSDIWWTQSFQFMYQPLTANAEIVTRITSINAPNTWSKFGLMIRESLDESSKYMFLMKTPGHGIVTQYKSTGNPVSSKENSDLSSIQWLKLKRSGSSFTSYYSYNGVDWILYDTKIIPMTTQEQIYIGLAVSGATSETKAIATFDNLTVTQEDANTIISASETNIISGTNVTFTNESLNTAVSQKWSFYGATISSSSAKSPVVCFIVPGTYPVSLVVTDSEGNKSLSNTLNINVVAPGLLISPVTSTTSWKLKSVSSEEISAEDGAATNAFDGDPNTYWHTKYHNGVSSYPHEIQIDLGSLYDLTGIGYLPRMGASGTNGRFKYFNIYASVDGNNWTFVRSATGSDDEYEKAYGFETVKAHYIKIIGTSACNYSKFGGAAEIKAYGTISDVNDVKNIIKPEFEIYSTRNKVYIDTGEIIGAKVFVYNLLGELIQTKELYNGLNSINLNVSGIYVIKVVDNNYVFSKIVIV